MNIIYVDMSCMQESLYYGIPVSYHEVQVSK